MAVMAREAWTDERLDDFRAQVDKRFDQVDQRFDRVEADIRELRSEMKSGFDSMQRTMIIGFVTLFASIVASVIGGVFAALAVG
jgi:hypothetical protein